MGRHEITVTYRPRTGRVVLDMPNGETWEVGYGGSNGRTKREAFEQAWRAAADGMADYLDELDD